MENHCLCASCWAVIKPIYWNQGAEAAVARIEQDAAAGMNGSEQAEPFV